MKPRITEKEWLAAKDMISLDLYRSAWKQFRKWRLFGIACCRRAMTLTPDERLETVAAAAEQFADELLTWEEMKKARRTLAAIQKELGANKFGPNEAKFDVLEALDHVTQKAPIASLGADLKAQFAFAAVSRPKYDTGLKQAEREQLTIARDIFGNPFRHVSFSESWRTDTVMSLARQMYESREFGAMPILADALQDTGCDNEGILSHCRDPKQVHVRGCWVVDLVLGKS